MKRWFLPAAARARGQSNDLNREILASNLFNCCKEVINAPPVPSISRCIHIVYQHKNVWEYQWSNFIYNCMSTFLHYVHCKDALLDCSAPGGERCESLTWVDEILSGCNYLSMVVVIDMKERLHLHPPILPIEHYCHGNVDLAATKKLMSCQLPKLPNAVRLIASLQRWFRWFTAEVMACTNNHILIVLCGCYHLPLYLIINACLLPI